MIAQMAISTDQAPKLLFLPAEIRDRIYSLVFVDIDDKVVLRILEPNTLPHLMRKLKPVRELTIHISLLLACRQTYVEASKYTLALTGARMTARNDFYW